MEDAFKMEDVFKGFDEQTVMITMLLIGAYMFSKMVLPRLIAGTGVPFVDCSQVQQSIQNGEELLVLDVRSQGEFTGRLGHVPGAVNVPLAELNGRLLSNAAEMDDLRDSPVYVMCRTNNRSPNAARALKKKGFTKVAVVKGGMSAWKRALLPIEG